MPAVSNSVDWGFLILLHIYPAPKLAKELRLIVRRYKLVSSDCFYFRLSPSSPGKDLLVLLAWKKLYQDTRAAPHHGCFAKNRVGTNRLISRRLHGHLTERIRISPVTRRDEILYSITNECTLSPRATAESNRKFRQREPYIVFLSTSIISSSTGKMATRQRRLHRCTCLRWGMYMCVASLYGVWW